MSSMSGMIAELSDTDLCRELTAAVGSPWGQRAVCSELFAELLSRARGAPGMSRVPPYLSGEFQTGASNAPIAPQAVAPTPAGLTPVDLAAAQAATKAVKLARILRPVTPQTVPVMEEGEFNLWGLIRDLGSASSKPADVLLAYGRQAAQLDGWFTDPDVDYDDVAPPLRDDVPANEVYALELDRADTLGKAKALLECFMVWVDANHAMLAPNREMTGVNVLGTGVSLGQSPAPARE